MKVVALIVMSLVMVRWTVSSPLPCAGEGCGPGKETHSMHHCKHIKSYEHYQDIIRSKRDFTFKNISNSVKRATIAFGKALHLVHRRGADESHSEHPATEISRNFNSSFHADSVTSRNISQFREVVPLVLYTEIRNDEPSDTTRDGLGENRSPIGKTQANNKDQDHVEARHSREAAKAQSKSNTTSTGSPNVKTKRQISSFKNESQEDQSKIGGDHNSTENKRQINEKEGQVHNTMVFKRQSSKNESYHPNFQNITIISKSPVKKRQTSPDHQNDTQETRNTAKVVRQESIKQQNNTKNPENTTRVVREISYLNDTEKRETQNITISSRQIQSDYQNGTEDSQNGTTVVRQTSFTPQSNIQEEQNTTRVVRQTSYEHQHQDDINVGVNNSTETKNETRIVRQALNGQNYTDQIQNTTRPVRQAFDPQNNTQETQNISRVVRAVYFDPKDNTTHILTTPQSVLLNSTEENQSITRVVRQAPPELQNDYKETQNATRIVRQSSPEHQNHTEEALNTTRVVRQTTSENLNYTQETQNSTRVVKQASPENQNHTEETQNISRMLRQTSSDHQNHTKETQNATRVVRQISSDNLNNTQETQNSTRVVRQTSPEHQNHTEETQNPTRFVRQISSKNLNSTQETQNLIRVVRQTSPEQQNHTEETQNLTRVVRQTSSENLNYTQETQNLTRVVRQTSPEHQNHTEKTQNPTRVVRQISSENLNYTQETQNLIRVIRQASPEHQNHTEETQNITRVVRQTSPEHQNHTNESHNISRMLRQTSSDHPNHTEETQNTTRVVRQISSDNLNYTQETQNTTRVERQTSPEHQNHTEETQNPTRVVRQTSSESLNYTQETQNLPKVVRQTSLEHQNHTEETQNITRVVRQTSPEHQNHTNETHNISRMLRQTSSDHPNHTEETQNTTRVVRQISSDNLNYTQETQNLTRVARQTSPEHQNHTEETQNTTRVVRQTSPEHQNHTNETHNISRMLRQTSSDHPNHTEETQNTTRVVRQISSDNLNYTQETQNLTRVVRQTSPEHQNHTEETQNTTRVVRQTSPEHQNHTNETHNISRMLRQTSSDHPNHTEETQNATRVVRQISSNNLNYTQETQNLTRIVRQTYPEHQNHTEETQNTTRVVRQTSPEHKTHTNETQNISRMLRQTSSDHQNHTEETQNMTRVVRQESSENLNSTHEIHNSTKNVRQTPSVDQNYTEPQETHNTTRIVRQVLNYQNATQETQHTTRVVRQSPDYRNHSQETQNATRVIRQTFNSENSTQESQNFTRVDRQASNVNQNDTEEAKNVTRIVRQTSEFQNNTQETLSFNPQNNTQESQGTTIVARQTFQLQNDTQEVQNITRMKRQATENHNNDSVDDNTDVQKHFKTKRGAYDNVILIRQLTNSKNDNDSDISGNSYSQYDDPAFRTLSSPAKASKTDFHPKYITQIFISVLKPNCTKNLESENIINEEYNPTESKITNKIKRQNVEGIKTGLLPADPPKNFKKPTMKEKYQQTTVSPKEAKELSKDINETPQNDDGVVDNVNIQIQKYQESQHYKRFKRANSENERSAQDAQFFEGRQDPLSRDSQLAEEHARKRIKKGEHSKNITIQIQKYVDDNGMSKKKREAENVTNNTNDTSAIQQPIKSERQAFEPSDDSSANVYNLNTAPVDTMTQKRSILKESEDRSICDCMDDSDSLDTNEVLGRNRRAHFGDQITVDNINNMPNNDSMNQKSKRDADESEKVATVYQAESVENTTKSQNASPPEVSIRAGDDSHIMTVPPRHNRSALLITKDTDTSSKEIRLTRDVKDSENAATKSVDNSTKSQNAPLSDLSMRVGDDSHIMTVPPRHNRSALLITKDTDTSSKEIRLTRDVKDSEKAATKSVDNSTKSQNASPPEVSIRAGDDSHIMTVPPRHNRSALLITKDTDTSSKEIRLTRDVKDSENAATKSVDNSTKSQNAPLSDLSMRAGDDSHIMTVPPRHNRSALLITKDSDTSSKEIRLTRDVKDSENAATKSVDNSTKSQNAPLSDLSMRAGDDSHIMTVPPRHNRSALLITKDSDTSSKEIRLTRDVKDSEKAATKSVDNSTKSQNAPLSDLSMRAGDDSHIMTVPPRHNRSALLITKDTDTSSKEIRLTRDVKDSEKAATKSVDNSTKSQNAPLPDVSMRAGDDSHIMTVPPRHNRSALLINKDSGTLSKQIRLTRDVNGSEKDTTVPQKDTVDNSSTPQNPSHQEISMRAGGDSHIMKIPPRHRKRRSALLKNRDEPNINIPFNHTQRIFLISKIEDDDTSSENSPVEFMKYDENGTNNLPRAPFIRKPILIRFSASPNTNTTSEFFEVSTENKKSFIEMVTDKFAISKENGGFYKYDFVEDDNSYDDDHNNLEKDGDIAESDDDDDDDIELEKDGDDAESEEAFKETKGDITKGKSSKTIDRVRCACATYPLNPPNQDRYPTLTGSYIEMPMGIKKVDKELLCTRNCSGMVKVDIRARQEVYCAHIKANDKFKKMFPSDQTDFPEVSEIIYCQIFTGETEPTLQFILSWLNVVLLDVVVCLTGLGIVCIYLICFVTFRKRDNGPVYTPAAFTVK